MQIQRRRNATIEAHLDQFERFALAIEGVLRDLEQLLVGQEREIRVGDFRNDADLRAAPRLYVAQVLLQPGMVQAAYAPEQVQLVGGKANADFEKPEYARPRSARGACRSPPPLPVLPAAAIGATAAGNFSISSVAIDEILGNKSARWI